MRRTIAVLILVLVAASAAGLAYQVAARQRDYRAAVRRGDAALRDDLTFAAIEAYSFAIGLRPDSMLAYLRRGETYRRRADRGDLDAAARDFRTAASLDPSAARPLEELGDVSYQLQRYDRAADAYERALRLDDRVARLAYKLALARYRDGDLDAALSAVTQATRIDGQMADAHYLLGVCLREKRRPVEAVKALEKAVSLAPALIPAREELADTYGELNRASDQLDQLQVLAGVDRSHVERHVAVGMAHARARHWNSAVLTLSSALERAPDNVVLYRALGQVWLESALARGESVDLSKAREALDRVAANDAATSEALMLSGKAALQDGDVAHAELALQLATQRFPVVPEALALYASVAERQGHFDNARRALIQYDALVAENRELVAHAAKIAALSMRVNDLETALAWVERGLRADPQDAQLLALQKRLRP